MALSEIQLANLSKRLRGYCEKRVPPHVRDRLRLDFRISGSAVELFEVRPRFDNRKQWIEHGVAKFRYVASRKTWELFCLHRDLRWHAYQNLPRARSFDALLREVDEDPTAIFWG